MRCTALESVESTEIVCVHINFRSQAVKTDD